MTELLTAIGGLIWSLALLIFAIGFLFLIAPIRHFAALLCLKIAARKAALLAKIANQVSLTEAEAGALVEAALEAPLITDTEIMSGTRRSDLRRKQG